MKLLHVTSLLITPFTALSLAQEHLQVVTFEQIFPRIAQQKMGLHKLTANEKEALRSHVQGLLEQVIKATESSGSYAGVGGGHWVRKNVNSGTYIILEDGSLWKIDPINKIDAMLWLPISSVTVLKSSSGSRGYNYLLINTDDGEEAHAKYMGRE